MKELIKDKLYSFDEKVRVELGPQIIELECTNKNLSNEVTHPNYQIGKRDAYGRIIRPAEAKEKVDVSMGIIAKGEKMACVDWRGKHAPLMWKVYVLQKAEMDRKTGKPNMRFIKINEFESKDDAISNADKLLKDIA